MFSVVHAEIIISFILLIAAYLLSVTLSGAIHAFVARSLGDYTAEEEGFLSGNPLVYVDLLGFLCLLFCGFGWGKRPPFQPYLIQEPLKSLKVLTVYTTEALCSLILALTALVAGIALSGRMALYIACNYHILHDIFERISFYDMASFLPHAQPMHLLLIMFCIMLTSLNILLALWSIINNFCRYLLFIGTEHNFEYARHEGLILLVGPLFLFIFIAPIIYNILVYSVCTLAYVVSVPLGLL